MTDKITIDRALLEQVLGAMDADPSRNLWAVARDRRRAISALREELSKNSAHVSELLMNDGNYRRKTLEQSQQEPVAWMCTETKVLYDHDTSEVDKYHGFKLTVPLYTAPPAPRRLTDGEIVDLWTDIALQDNGSGWHAIGKRFARAIEARILGGKT